MFVLSFSDGAIMDEYPIVGCYRWVPLHIQDAYQSCKQRITLENITSFYSGFFKKKNPYLVLGWVGMMMELKLGYAVFWCIWPVVDRRSHWYDFMPFFGILIYASIQIYYKLHYATLLKDTIYNIAKCLPMVLWCHQSILFFLLFTKPSKQHVKYVKVPLSLSLLYHAGFLQ